MMAKPTGIPTPAPTPIATLFEPDVMEEEAVGEGVVVVEEDSEDVTAIAGVLLVDEDVEIVLLDTGLMVVTTLAAPR